VRPAKIVVGFPKAAIAHKRHFCSHERRHSLRLEAENTGRLGTCLQNADLNLWAGTAPSVVAPVGSGCWIIGPILLATVAIVWAHGALAR
jgi:hypothetical protein